MKKTLVLLACLASALGLWLAAQTVRGGNLYFIGATLAADLEVRYEQIWPVLGAPGDAPAAIGVATILSYWTAGLMATAMREQALGQQYIGEARHLLDR